MNFTCIAICTHKWSHHASRPLISIVCTFCYLCLCSWCVPFPSSSSVLPTIKRRSMMGHCNVSLTSSGLLCIGQSQTGVGSVGTYCTTLELLKAAQGHRMLALCCSQIGSWSAVECQCHQFELQRENIDFTKHTILLSTRFPWYWWICIIILSLFKPCVHSLTHSLLRTIYSNVQLAVVKRLYSGKHPIASP